MDNENLGEFLAGDRIESSPYLLRMKVEMYCQQVCISNLGKAEQKGMKVRSHSITTTTTRRTNLDLEMMEFSLSFPTLRDLIFFMFSLLIGIISPLSIWYC
jgi:hypothetical protein